jgi:CheY-like chemotaxis protein
VAKILLIDDNEDLLNLEKTMLEMGGHSTLTAQGGEIALQILSTDPELDLILLDVTMDGMSGPEFLARFEKELPKVFEKIPVVYVSNVSEAPANSKAKGFMLKPTSINGFITAVDKFLK